MINVSLKRQENVLGLEEKKHISRNCPYHFIYKYTGHVLIMYCPFHPHLPTENNQGSGDIFDA